MTTYAAGVTDKDVISQLSDSNLRLALKRTRLRTSSSGASPKERVRVAKARRYMQALKAELKTRKGPSKKTAAKKGGKRKAPKRRVLKRKSTISKTRAKTVLSKLKRDGFYLDASGKVTANDDLYMSQK